MNTKGLTDFFENNWKAIGGFVLAVAVVLGGIGIWNAKQKQIEAEATNLLYTAQSTARPLVEAKKYQEAEAAFAKVLEAYPHSRAAFEAALQMGDVWMEAASYANAIKHYEKAVELADDSFSKLLARYNLGIAQETAGEHKAAADSYEAALKMEGSDFLRPEILMAQARSFEALEQVGKAIEIYQRIQKDFSDRSYYSGAASAFEKQLSGSQISKGAQ